ncbi:hypothetical protein G8O24_42030 [Bradyrhizobium sp. INPA01-394B]|uniref:Uncharacterized protein n=1 Tax=Bradyrhizobium campsiandrae TaxID=1729892 RepID=A0ABR7U0I6_9BRAD|nr:hypothetical protein [Bradyrhizobium campsiandrae]MBC9883855.1 hypothetical protein [Bradyrhizobium campsiandrae]MBC9976797.1 hypothetical protein [Bradyrhizobium campsiandrae]
MFDYLRFQWELSKIQRADLKKFRKYEDWIKEAKAKKDSAGEIETLEYERNMDGIDSADEIRRLHSRYYTRQAARMLIPLPDASDKTMWEHVPPNRVYCTEQGIMHIRSIVRAERKARLEMFLMWVPGVVGLLGGAIGLASILMRK